MTFGTQRPTLLRFASVVTYPTMPDSTQPGARRSGCSARTHSDTRADRLSREGDVRHHVGAARKYAEIAQIIAQGIEVGEEFSVILEINLALVGQAPYVKTEEGIFINSETGTAEMLHLALGVPFETALEVNSKE